MILDVALLVLVSLKIKLKIRQNCHDGVIRLKHFARYWPFVWAIHRPVTRCFDVFFDLCLNQQLSNHWRRRLFETPSRSIWCHYYGTFHKNRLGIIEPKTSYFYKMSLFLMMQAKTSWDIVSGTINEIANIVLYEFVLIISWKLAIMFIEMKISRKDINGNCLVKRHWIE